MSKQYAVVEKDGQKWLRTYHPDEVIYGEPRRYTPIPYVGTHPPGTTLDESQVREVRQVKESRVAGIVWITTEDYERFGVSTRTAYTDADHLPDAGNMVDKPFKVANVRPLVNQMLAEEISFSRFVEILNETATPNTKMQCHCEDEDMRYDCLADCDHTGAEHETMLNRYRVGRRLGRAVLDDVQGKYIVVFEVGMEHYARDFCDWLNSRRSIENKST